MCPSIHASRLSKLFTMLQKSVRNSTIRLIVNQRFVERSKPVTQPLKKNNLPTFTSTKKKTVSKKKKAKIGVLKEDCALFLRLYIAKESKIILNRNKKIAEEVLPESQCGFRAGRSTIYVIFTLRQLQEKAIEKISPPT